MNGLDYVILGIITVSSLISVWRGFLKEIFSLGAWIAAGIVTFTFAGTVAVLVPDFVQSPTLRLAIAAFVLFVATLFLGGVVNYLIHKAMAKVGLTGTDRLLGLLFGIARGVIIVLVIVLLAGLTPLPQESWWQNAVLIDYFVSATLWLQSYLPESVTNYLAY
ncbi:MAG: CvpA family protein [Pseudomonadota bacterium]